VAKIARLKAIERERATPGTGTLSPSSATLSATATEEEEEVVDDEVSLGDDGPVKPDAWAVRHQKGHVPALQGELVSWAVANSLILCVCTM
jgi:hypothetical protein